MRGESWEEKPKKRSLLRLIWDIFWWCLPIVGVFSVTWMSIVLLGKAEDGELIDYFVTVVIIVLLCIIAIIDKDAGRYPITFEDTDEFDNEKR